LPDADKEDAVKVSITRDSQVFLSPGLERVNPDDLAPKVRDLLQNRVDKTVFLRADARAKYGKVEDVVDNLRSGGVDQLGLLADQDMTALPNQKK
jgi:biopolymer transport protein ExbD/biopolymer transport protein TolR